VSGDTRTNCGFGAGVRTEPLGRAAAEGRQAPALPVLIPPSPPQSLKPRGGGTKLPDPGTVLTKAPK